jgi:hypothetical protein
MQEVYDCPPLFDESVGQKLMAVSNFCHVLEGEVSKLGDYQVFLAGGAIRDAILGFKPLDYDVFIVSKFQKVPQRPKKYGELYSDFINKLNGFNWKEIVGKAKMTGEGVKNFEWASVAKGGALAESSYGSLFDAWKYNDGDSEAFKPSIFEILGKFTGDSADSSEKIQIIFRPDCFGVNDLLYGFDFTFCQFAISSAKFINSTEELTGRTIHLNMCLPGFVVKDAAQYLSMSEGIVEKIKKGYISSEHILTCIKRMFKFNERYKRRCVENASTVDPTWIFEAYTKKKREENQKYLICLSEEEQNFPF